MTNQEILDNAPEGATHYENYYNFYWKREVIIGWTVFIDGAWAESDLNDFDDVYDVRSLADIRRIVELERALADAQTTINQLQGDYHGN